VEPDIERVLSSAGTSPLDFTLHDAEHSFRVAEWMAKIVPGDVLEKLSGYELALLLLSAYLHDIGMTPEQARVQRHWRARKKTTGESSRDREAFPVSAEDYPTARALARVLKVARTIADLAAADRIGPAHVAEAIYC